MLMILGASIGTAYILKHLLSKKESDDDVDDVDDVDLSAGAIVKTSSFQTGMTDAELKAYKRKYKGQAIPNPAGNRTYEDLLLLDYVVDPSTPTVTKTKPYKDLGDLTLSLKRAPALGLAVDPSVNAKRIAQLLGVNADKYVPTDDEVTKLAYVISRERSSGANIGQGSMSPVNVQRERAALLWAMINAIPAYIQHYGYDDAPHTIGELLARGTEYVNYVENPKMSNFDVMNKQLSPDNRNIDPINFRTFVKAFFDGHFNDEIGNNTNWVHAKIKSWTFFVIPPKSRFSDEKKTAVKSTCDSPKIGCTSSEDVYIFLPDGIFGRAFIKHKEDLLTT